ncbi:MAG: dCTP deaminase [Dehalococcoidia bacterium]
MRGRESPHPDLITMVLSDRDIRAALAAGRIRIMPAIDEAVQLGPCSVDLRLGPIFKVFDYSRVPYVDTRTPMPDEMMREVVVEGEGPFVLHPGEMVLASTLESLELPDDMLARLEGRSSLARLGIIVHGTAGVFEPGWRGKAVLELSNLSRVPVALYPTMRICSFTFEPLSSPSENPYWKRAASKYVGQAGAEASRLWADSELAPWMQAFWGPGSAAPAWRTGAAPGADTTLGAP